MKYVKREVFSTILVFCVRGESCQFESYFYHLLLPTCNYVDRCCCDLVKLQRSKEN